MQTLRRLFGFLRPYLGALLVVAILLLLGTSLELIPPLVQRAIIDNVIGNRDSSSLAILLGSLVGIHALRQGIHVGDTYIRHALGARFILDLRVRLYAYLQRLSLSFFESTSTGELMSRVTNDVNTLERFITHGSAFVIVDLLRLVGAGGVLFFLDARLALLALIPVPIMAVSLRYYNTNVRPIYRRVRDRLGDINAKLQDSLSGIQVIQAFGREEQELQRFATESENYYQARVEGIRQGSIFFPAMHFLGAMGRTLILGGGATLVLGEELSLGTLVAFLSYLHLLYAPINRLIQIDDIIQEAIAAGDRVFALLDEYPQVEDAPDAVELGHVQGDITFKDVWFCYPTGDDVLRGVSFHIEPGQVVALVGPSGAGKTSIANLLCRFYDPTQGKIALDGHDLRDITLASLREQIGIVLQDTFLFNTTVRENLLYGKPGASEKELIAAARAAHAHDFVMSLPDGYDTEIGERGVRLSGGQKQRLALTRAILADPQILILDEATSSVDAEAEYLIQRALDAVLQGRTALVIAHRLSTIRGADKIIALEEGRIVEIGDHHELLALEGLYSKLYQRQLRLVTDEV